MQATVRTFDPQTRSGSVLLDDAFERVAGILESPESGTLWVTAAPGCEFEVPGGNAHLGGSSHGGLRLLRFGQRVRIEVADGRVAFLTLSTF